MSEALTDHHAVNQIVRSLTEQLAQAQTARRGHADNSRDAMYCLGQIDALKTVLERAREAFGLEDPQEPLQGPAPPYRTATGKLLTDEDIQALADEAERGYDVSHLTRFERPGPAATALERIDYHLTDHGGRLLRTQSRLNQIEADLQGINEKLDRLLAIQDPAT